MSFEEVLAKCLTDLERGRSLEECLAQYPGQSAELAPILRMIASMRGGPKPRLSERAFARGRAAVAAYARHQQQLREPFIAATPRAAQTRSLYAPPTITPRPKAAPLKPSAPPLPARGFRQMYRLTRLFVLLLLVFSFASFVRGVAVSLPGSLLYPVKGWGENAQGLLMLASGQQASWHVNQLERRLSEFAWLTQQGAPVDSTLTMAIDDHLQAALDGSAALAADQRQQFLTTWLDRLHTLQNRLPAATTTVATLNRAISTVEQAMHVEGVPTILPTENTPTPTVPVTVESTPTRSQEILLPTLTPTETDTPAPPEVLATPTPTAAETLAAPVEAVTAPPVEATPTAIPTILVANPPTVTQAPLLIPADGNTPAEADDGTGNNSSKPATPTPTSMPELPTVVPTVATVQPPRIPLPTPGDGNEPVTPAPAGTTDGAKQTPIPGGIPTSAEPPTPVPTEGAKNTPSASATKPAEPTPTREENKSSTPEATKPAEPTATEKAATPTRPENKGSTPEATNTPKPEETKAETPAPANETPAADDTPEEADPADDATPEPTPTPKKKKK